MHATKILGFYKLFSEHSYNIWNDPPQCVTCNSWCSYVGMHAVVFIFSGLQLKHSRSASPNALTLCSKSNDDSDWNYYAVHVK